MRRPRGMRWCAAPRSGCSSHRTLSRPVQPSVTLPACQLALLMSMMCKWPSRAMPINIWAEWHHAIHCLSAFAVHLQCKP